MGTTDTNLAKIMLKVGNNGEKNLKAPHKIT
jgi:hypothetical protein